ncbi:universal stress protein [Rathayibacter soli]|uniref:universal stress protein n=1 Tax=Rathayibacter soli TaxID=3144168 RepID=UPI0027E549BD|nr:universal stress protein [Glaciibacter superstes]
MARTILVGVTGTEPSRAALRWSMKRAAAIGAEVTLCYVLDDGWATIGARMLSELREDASRLLEGEADYARSIAPEVVVHTQLLRGSLMKELAAASKSVDFVAVGTHKTGFVNGKVFGSRSLLLAAEAHAPVAVVPQGSPRDGRGVVVGVDDSAAGRAAIRFGANEAERAGETLTLIRADDLPDIPVRNDAMHRELRQHVESRASTLLADAADRARSVSPTVEVRTRSVPRPAAAVLADAAAGAALLVIGSSRRDESGQSMVGSVSHDVLINLTGPTVVVHPGDVD